jgi:hypothetical protein
MSLRVDAQAEAGAPDNRPASANKSKLNLRLFMICPLIGEKIGGSSVVVRHGIGDQHNAKLFRPKIIVT